MRINNLFTKFAKSNLGQKAYKNILHPNRDNFLNNHLPIIESAVVTSFYVLSTQIQKDIPSENKKSIQIQNLLSFLVSTCMAVPLNKGVTKVGEGIIKHLKPEMLNEAHKIIDGIKVGLPMLSTLFITRFAVAVGLVPLSTKIRDTINKKLDVKA